MIRASLFVLLTLAFPSSLQAGQETGVDRPASDPGVASTTDAAPSEPAHVSHDADGRIAVRALRVRTSIRVDGRLDETHYAGVPAISSFIQSEPTEGAPATEKTEIWVFFDDAYEHLVVGEDFNPEVGFVRRDDMRRNFGLVRFSPRLRNSHVVRKLFWTASGTHVADSSGRFETRELDGEFRAELHSADRFVAGYTSVHEAGSELFIVWNEQRDTAVRRFPDLANRAFIVKMTRLIRF